MNEEISHKEKRYCKKEIIHIIKSVPDKEKSKAENVITYENGAFFKYADLHSKIVKLYLELPIERFGKNGVFFQNNAEYKPLTLSVISPKCMKLSSLSTKAFDNKMNMFPRKLEKSNSSQTICNSRINIISRESSLKKGKDFKYRNKKKLKLAILQKEKNFSFIKGNKFTFNRAMSPPLKSKYHSYSNIANKNGYSFMGSSLKKNGSYLNVNRLFLKREGKGSLLRNTAFK